MVWFRSFSFSGCLVSFQPFIFQGYIHPRWCVGFLQGRSNVWGGRKANLKRTHPIVASATVLWIIKVELSPFLWSSKFRLKPMFENICENMIRSMLGSAEQGYHPNKAVFYSKTLKLTRCRFALDHPCTCHRRILCKNESVEVLAQRGNLRTGYIHYVCISILRNLLVGGLNPFE